MRSERLFRASRSTNTHDDLLTTGAGDVGFEAGQVANPSHLRHPS